MQDTFGRERQRHEELCERIRRHREEAARLKAERDKAESEKRAEHVCGVDGR